MKKTTIIDIVNAPELSDEAMYKLYTERHDREIMGALFRKYMALVFGVCMKFLREKNMAQDATMDIFEHLIKHEPSSEIRNFKAFLYVVSKNYCLMKQRGERQTEIKVSDTDMESVLQVHPIDSNPDESKTLMLEKCIKLLNELQKECITHFYLQKKSYLEISSELKVTLSAVKSHIQNGKRNLKICLETSQ